MGSFLISIKRFFQNKNTVTIFALLVAVGIIYYSYNLRIKKSTEPVNVPYATMELGPRTYITSDMVSTKKVPGGVVTKDVINSSKNIVGKYVSNRAVIPEGSMFYESMVIEWDKLPSSNFENIGDGQTIYQLKVDSNKTYGNSIYPGNYIDIYYVTRKKEKNNSLWIGKFIEGIRVLDVVDSAGNSVFETNGAPLQPSKIQFNVDDPTFLLFKKIDLFGDVDLFPVQRNAAYSKQEHKAKIVGNEFAEYIKSRAVQDSTINGGK